VKLQSGKKYHLILPEFELKTIMGYFNGLLELAKNGSDESRLLVISA